ncbi:MAG: caspase family protein [Mesorhizobium sp.]|uniref:caspase family protein n=1 Tax=Mesorhizobium sp. TaxID=1871066 RepID=UPI000FE7AD1E|nr:caspase family protein [Mesorhizobium sp.]RWH69534.1 MAG: caspase family protein [Mesorhizobium sp.]RWH76082.1 MAG: caspase family protein [Mesorhizobium sp.]RWH83461.1 MAG: caspase family protein [Mesorhizobium sp.]RWH91363.1 MAG: caspase family protein [Mesorhizobium sp.]RWI04775.1 MAG: caspase family protein [Mesorhizobium sp.]
MSYRLLLRIAVVLLVSLFGSLGVRAAVEEGQSPQPGKRLAIVIGNSDYRSAHLPHLANAANDAARLSESLKRLKFDVLTATNLSSDGFTKLFEQAEGKLAGASAVLIFYAGHGVQLGGENYLLPVDTPNAKNLQELIGSAVKLNDVISRFASRERQTFVFLDACRNNPMGKGPSAMDGLAQIEVGENTFIAFATQPGNVAVDGSGDNSPFTTALLKNVEIPGLSISDMMIRVRNETEAITIGRQVPWDQSNLREQFYFTEQQVLDPAQLSASLSRILADPAAKERLKVELASNDLQTAVLIVGQTLRSVEVSPLPDAAAKPAGTQVASLEGAKQSIVSGLEALIVGTSATETDSQKATDLARSIQTELRRLGCYRMTVDGSWGKGSVRALTNYYKNTARTASATEPTVELLSDLFLHSGRVCKDPVVVRKIKPAKVASEAAPARKGAGNRKAARSQQQSSRPVAPPPDISGGIGIGGVF